MNRRLLALGLLLSLPASAEEGMWTYDAFPADAVKKAYGFAPDLAWLDKVRLGSVRLAGGCSASFVSPDGLVMTNHHCVRSCIEDLTTAKDDLLAKGFQAKSAKEERRCPKIEANQLVEMTDVTPRMNTATKGLTGAAFNTALKKETAAVEAACATGNDVRCDVVTLYNGGKYQLYKYRRFQDVRLVFAPEFSMAAFGGDADNFNFPRFGYDVAFMRVWDGEAPAKSPHYLPWAKEGVKEGELVFVSGHPGGTERKSTVAELEFQRDVALPNTLLSLAEMRGMLREYASGSPDRYRLARSRLRGVENGLKALKGRQQALADPALLARKRQEEAELKKRIDANPQAKASTQGMWEETARALDTWRRTMDDHRMKGAGDAFRSELFTHAQQLVRAAEELPKPNAERLREYTDGQLPALRQQLLREAPIPPELETLGMTFGFNKLRETLGADDPFVRLVLGKEAPADLARSLVRGTKLGDVNVRKALLEGGKAAVEASKDPMILLARKVDAETRASRKQYEDTVEAVLKRNGERLAKAYLAVNGTSGAPDATFTLRLNYGQVKGWDDNGKPVPALTTFGGAYGRDTGKDPFKLPDPWVKAKGKVPEGTPLDMATTNDIIGGNSGSPVVNRDGQVVGLIFDGNLPSLGGRYAYVPESNRAVAVHGDGILAALEHVYGATRVVNELKGAQQAPVAPGR
ncbi:S46 family peptidase [Corallococcus llansteffanensis]|uniref:Dipeptidyl-peptidase n=1 Tax=Corallococcus llansteffanensis TaxID=2316731 RepID=A0A3A8PQ29_9BACT|nr:S46 family peptidase [Corallococcus llansteffanensis]RKH58339.1 S46 family peptidase [Corallococcus llansteffanensis]